MKVIITDHTGSKKTPVDLPENAPMRRLVPALVTKLSLPETGPNGQNLTYVLDHRKSGKRLGPDDTLTSAGVQTDDQLALLGNPTAGADVADPHLRRLLTDYDRLQRLVAQSDLVKLAAVDGSPPYRYLIDFTCKGVERLDNDRPVYRDYHQMGIVLTGDYPTQKPGLRFLTPIFHPNISSQGDVCIGPWYASKGLDDLVIMVAEMIQYKIPPTSDELGDVLNDEAVNWISRNRRLLPVDRREIRSVGSEAFEDLLGQIRIGDEPVPSSPSGGDLLTQIRLDPEGHGTEDDLMSRIRIGD